MTQLKINLLDLWFISIKGVLGEKRVARLFCKNGHADYISEFLPGEPMLVCIRCGRVNFAIGVPK